MQDEIADMINRLHEISIYQGIPYGRVNLIFEKEQEFGKKVADTMHGYIAISDAFKNFFLETVESVNTECYPKVTQPISADYLIFTARLVHNFESLVAAERVALHGYPLHAYTLHRNNFDNLLLTAAALQKVTTFPSIEGFVPGQPSDQKSVYRLRKDTETLVQEFMLGSKSGLSKETIEALTTWDRLFNLEVHGGRLSMTKSIGWFKGESPLSVLPIYDEQIFAVHMNRFVEISWILCRLLPLLQPPGTPLSDDWSKKWEFLDHSLETFVTSLSKQLGKKIGDAMAEFVKAKIPFKSDSHFPL